MCVRSIPWLAQTPLPMSAPLAVEACVPRSADVRAVEREDIHGVWQLMLLCERDEPIRELVVIRSAGVLRADGYGVFAARKIEPHAAHIHRDKLIDIARERARAVADLFVYNKVYARRMAERRLFSLHQRSRRRSSTALALSSINRDFRKPDPVIVNFGSMNTKSPLSMPSALTSSALFTSSSSRTSRWSASRVIVAASG